jgi:hypothetical protein
VDSILTYGNAGTIVSIETIVAVTPEPGSAALLMLGGAVVRGRRSWRRGVIKDRRWRLCETGSSLVRFKCAGEVRVSRSRKRRQFD